MFSKNINVAYFYLVSFVSLFVLVGGLISTANALAILAFPYNYYPDPGIKYNNTSDIRNLVNCVAVVVVSLPVFLIHWVYIAKKLLPKKEAAAEVAVNQDGGAV